MSRVHDALRRAENGAAMETAAGSMAPPVLVSEPPARGPEFLPVGTPPAALPPVRLNIHAGMLGDAPLVPFQPAPESHLLDLNNSHDTPAEEFRTLRTRLNHMQTLQPLHNIIVTSPSPAEGKTFSAVNLAL